MTKRRIGPSPHQEDPYTKLVSPHGIPVDQLVSVLQKEIRRSNVDNAVLAAYEMLITSDDVANHMWHRLRLIAVEDVGMGEPLAPLLVSCLEDNYNILTGSEKAMMAIHAVRLLANAKKDRTSSEHTDLVINLVERGEALVEVPDYALCVHTRAGQDLGRGLMQWRENGAKVNDEFAGADHRYRKRLIEICLDSEAAG
jgi:replication-associated recombination protein RarA